jgi:hypothetical protein
MVFPGLLGVLGGLIHSADRQREYAMKTSKAFLCFCAIALIADTARGHGVSIELNFVNDQVTASGGVVDEAGFARLIFVDGSPDALLSHEDVPGFGNVAFTDVPGFVPKEGIGDHAVFNMYVIPRPVRGSNPIQERVLWHWSSASQSVALAPNGESLTVFSSLLGDQITIPQLPPAPRALFAAHVPPEERGQHLHYLQYLLDDSPLAAAGAYGFFAQFELSPPFPAELSEPLLIVLNNGLDETSLMTAALAINAAAGDAVALEGDFNNDGTVDAADYVAWRKGIAVPSTPQNYALWRANFDRTAGAGSNASATGAIPEPACIGLVICAILCTIARRNSPISIDSIRRTP